MSVADTAPDADPLLDPVTGQAPAAVADPGAAAVARGSRFGVVRRLGWGVADQAVSSLSNFALNFFVARAFPEEDFGAFTLAYVTYAVVLNAARGLATDPLLVRHSGAGERRWRRVSASALGTSLVVGVAAGLLSLVAGLLLPAPVGPVFLALAVGLPGIVLQDAWRFAFFAVGRPAMALVNDVAWTILLGAALAVIFATGAASVVTCMLAFGLTATVCGVLGIVQARVWPAPWQALRWLRTYRSLSLRYLVENISFSGVAQVRSFVLGSVAGLASVGHVRVAEMLLGPFLVVLMGVSQVAVPEASRVLRRSVAALPRFCLMLGGVQGLGALLWGASVLVGLSFGLGDLLLGKSLWGAAQPLLPAATLYVVASCFVAAGTTGLRAMGVAWRSLRAQLASAALYLVGAVGGAVVAHAAGTAWGSAGATAAGALVWWYHLRAAVADRAAGVDGGTDGGLVGGADDAGRRVESPAAGGQREQAADA